MIFIEEVKQEAAETPNQQQSEKKNTVWTIIGIALVLLLFGAIVVGFTFRSSILSAISNAFSIGKKTTQVATETETGPEEKVIQGGVEEAEEVSPTPTEGVAPEGEDDLIKQAVIDMGGFAASKVEVTIGENTGTHAKGGVKEVGSEVGGGYFIAAKKDGKWVGVYSGQANPTCEQIEPYDFPTDMVEECLDENNEVVAR